MSESPPTPSNGGHDIDDTGGDPACWTHLFEHDPSSADSESGAQAGPQTARLTPGPAR